MKELSRYRTLFPYKPDPMPSFLRHLLRWRIQNLNLFWGLQKFLEASEAEKKKQSQVHHFLGKKWNKDEFFMRWTIRIFVVQWSFEKLDFFYLPIKKIGFITLIVSKFQILKAYLWLIYRKRVEFIVHTLIFEFQKIWFFELLRPSRTFGQGQERSNFGFLTFRQTLKN